MSKTALWLGFDPDLHTSAMAVCTRARVVQLLVARGESLYDMATAISRAFHQIWAPPDFDHYFAGVVIESPEIYPGGMTKKPMDILHLAQVAGMAFQEATAHFADARIEPLLVLPRTWKGQVPKHTHQSVVLDRYSIKNKKLSPKEGARPTSINEVSGMLTHGNSIGTGDWKHLGDAIGLARYGAYGYVSIARE